MKNKMDPALREELKKNFRNNLLETLELISSKKDQLEYQKNVPVAYVSAEIFCWWEDDYQIPKNEDWYQEAFSKGELEILAEFDKEFEIVANKTPDNLPDIEEFVLTPEWRELSSAAKAALKKLVSLG
ncbi:MAG: hypothetical protein ACRBDI_07040 [Alphaproteobacteria bacterium]